MKIVEGPRRFRYTVEVCLPDTLSEEAWHDKLMTAIFRAIYAQGGTIFCATNENQLIQVKEIKATKEN